MITFLLGFTIGLFSFIGYVAFRALRYGSWDSSNLFNVLRAIAFFATHPEVFPYLMDTRQDDPRKAYPFWYLPHDEFKEVVETV
jgi:hypothetical protein